MNKAVVGDPLNDETTVGPMARRDLRDDLHKQVTDSIAKKARVSDAVARFLTDPARSIRRPMLTDLKPGHAGL